jgi:hypothetical protein
MAGNWLEVAVSHGNRVGDPEREPTVLAAVRTAARGLKAKVTPVPER